MAKASPARNNFNGGEVSPLMYQRQDIDRYPSFMRVLKNAVAAPQGPAIGRSGTRYQQRVQDSTKKSALVPFVFSDTQSNQLEFGHFKMRVHSDVGLLTYGFVAITTVLDDVPFRITCAAVAAICVVGDSVAFSGFPASSSLEGVVAKVTLIAGNTLTLDVAYSGATGAIAGAMIAKVYEVTTPYNSDDVNKIVAVQSLDEVYLYCEGYRLYKLQRYGELDWRLGERKLIDGPYLDQVNTGDTLTPNVTGSAVEIHTTNVGVNGTAGAAATAWMAFDGDEMSVWDSGTNQTGTLTYVFTVATVIEGYVLYGTKDNTNVEFSSQAARPVNWSFEASVDGTTNWITLDEQNNYALWQNHRTQYIRAANKTAYKGYRVVIKSLEGSGAQTAKLARLVLRKAGDVVVRLTASAVTAINRGQGFLATDVGRLIRVRQTDGFWRALEISAVISTTVVDAKLQGEPLLGLKPINQWRLGAYSDTTGWPTTGSLFLERMAMGGAKDSPTSIALSQPYAPDVMSPTDTDGTLVPSNGLYLTPTVRNATPLRWLIGTDKGLICGYGSSEWIITVNSNAASFGATNVKAVKSTVRGSAKVQALEIDNQALFVQANGKTLREYAYTFETESFKSPSMSLFASHFGVHKFVQIVHAAEPHSIIWVRRENNTVVGLTYNKDERVVGWHDHDFGGEVESMSVLPGSSGQDELWIVIKRADGAGFVRNIEKLTRFWEFGDTLDEAYRVDCARRVTRETAATTVNHARHLEGKRVYGLADGKEFGYEESVIVSGGNFELPFPAKNVVYGLPYEVYGETVNFEAGSEEGTAQAKTKRIHEVTVAVWDTYGGEFGIMNEDTGEYEFVSAAGMYTQDATLEDVQLYTGFVGPITPPQGYVKRASLVFKQTKPFPLNVVAMYPKLDTTG